MNYSPKLKMAAEEMKEIIKKYDIAAVVILHTPMFGEYLVELSPSYSCAKIENGRLRLKSNAKDYAGGIEEQRTHLQNTSNMLNIMSDIAGLIMPGIMEANDLLTEKVDAIHTKGDHTSHESQNN